MIKAGGRRSGGPIGSSLPRHDTKDQKDRQTEKNQKRKQEKPRANCKLAQNNIENNNLYDA